MPPGIPVRGLTLVPLTLGHLLLLERMRSPYASGDPHPTSGQTALALWICSRDWQTAASRINAFWTRWVLSWMGAAVNISPEWYADRLREYFAFHRQSPDRRELRERSADELPPMGAPLVAALKVGVMAELGISEADALDRPLLACLWDLAVCRERAGAIQIIRDPTDAEIAEQQSRDSDFVTVARRIVAENKARLEGAPRG